MFQIGMKMNRSTADRGRGGRGGEDTAATGEHTKVILKGKGEYLVHRVAVT